jgi:methionyl-tRNA formyltransferase
MAGIVLLGMSGTFSRVALEALIAAGASVRALVVPGRAPRLVPRPQRLLFTSAETASHVAWAHGLPVVEVGPRVSGEPPGILRDLRPDVLAVACFPWLLPRAWRQLAPEGALNVHPSLLPAYRGPAPLFWQLRVGETRTGVTVHCIDEGLDTGDILAQAEVPFADGLTRDALEALLAETGARLLAEAVRAPARGRPQPAAASSHQGPPGASDLEVPTTWTARRAFNFMRGATGWGPFTIVGAGVPIAVREALSFDARGGEPGAVGRTAGGVEVGFSPGTVVVLSESKDLPRRAAGPSGK